MELGVTQLTLPGSGGESREVGCVPSPCAWQPAASVERSRAAPDWLPPVPSDNRKSQPAARFLHEAVQGGSDWLSATPSDNRRPLVGLPYHSGG